MPDIILEADDGLDRAANPEEDVLETGNGDNQNAASGPLGIDSPRRMDLTAFERDLAINIKEAIAATPDVDPVSDFMCAQLALIDGDDTEAAIERVHHLQGLREEYGILDTAEHGRKCFADNIELFPGLHLGFTYVPEEGTYVMIFDNQKFYHSEINSEERLRAWIGGVYYTCVALCPDFEAIRSGCILVAECEGYDWKDGMDFKSLKKMWSEVGSVYPCWFQKIKYFNAPNSMAIVANMMKPVFPEHLRGKVEFGCQFEERLDSIYMVPTVEAGNLRFLLRTEETLNRRYKNEQSFRL